MIFDLTISLNQKKKIREEALHVYAFEIKLK